MILDATAHIWARDGYDAVNTNRVAHVAGVSIGSLYQYFSNKGVLVGAVAVRHSEAMATVFENAAKSASSDSLRSLVETLIRATLAAHAENPRLRRAIIEELPRIGWPKRIADLKLEIRRAVVELLSRYRDQIGVTDLDLAAFVIINSVEHLTHIAETENSGFVEGEALEGQLNRLIINYLVAGSASSGKRGSLSSIYKKPVCGRRASTVVVANRQG